MTNKKQASLILRILGGPSPLYLVQRRDNIRDAPFRFPGLLSLFGGAVEQNETGEVGFRREMCEELSGIDFSSLNLKHRVYHWKEDLTTVESEIDSYFKGNFDLVRGFRYDEFVPQIALGVADRGKKLTYLDFILAVEEDHYFEGEVNLPSLAGIVVHEGQSILVPETLCPTLVFYPTDKLALMHHIAKANCE